LWPLISSYLVSVLQLSFVSSMFVFLGFPSLLLTIVLKQKAKKSWAFSLVMGVPLAIIIDYMMEIKEAWVLGESFFGSLRLFNYVFIEQIPWLALFAFLVVGFYQYFSGEYDGLEVKRASLKVLGLWHGFLMILFMTAWAYFPEILKQNYAYLKIGIVFGLLPILYAFINYPKMLLHFAIPVIYFFYFSLTYELISLNQGHWAFPNKSQFIGHLSILGHSFPYEEMVFWIILGPASCLSYFEIFKKN